MSEMWEGIFPPLARGWGSHRWLMGSCPGLALPSDHGKSKGSSRLSAGPWAALAGVMFPQGPREWSKRLKCWGMPEQWVSPPGHAAAPGAEAGAVPVLLGTAVAPWAE